MKLRQLRLVKQKIGPNSSILALEDFRSRQRNPTFSSWLWSTLSRLLCQLWQQITCQAKICNQR